MNTKSIQSDYGADPIGDGTFRLIPSGRIVNREERDRILKSTREVHNNCFGLSWSEIERKQGGKLRP
jgi:hypothetical protein